MVEFAIILVALFTLIFGILEGGFAVRARSTVNNAVDDAARRGAVAGTSADADYLIMRQLIGRGADAAGIEYVVIYKAENGSSPIPAGCIDGNP
jgi:Flp pilus assembly protein TadG